MKPEGDVTRYTISTANNLGASTVMEAFKWTLSDHVNFAWGVGMDGVEWWPNNPILPRVSSYPNSYRRDWREGVLSAHQTARLDTTKMIQLGLKELLQVVHNPKDTLRKEIELAAAYMLLNSGKGSFRQITNLRQEMKNLGLPNRDFGVNIYPEEGYEAEYTALPQRLVQTYPDVCNHWGISSAEALVDKAEAEGIDLCLATHHIRRVDRLGQPSFLNSWEAVIPTLLKRGRDKEHGRVAQIHLEAYRTDMPGDVKKTIGEGNALYSNDQSSEIFRMLRLVADYGFKGLVTFETRTDGMVQLFEPSGGKLTLDDQKRYYTQALKNVSEILGKS